MLSIQKIKLQSATESEEKNNVTGDNDGAVSTRGDTGLTATDETSVTPNTTSTVRLIVKAVLPVSGYYVYLLVRYVFSMPSLLVRIALYKRNYRYAFTLVISRYLCFAHRRCKTNCRTVKYQMPRR